MWLNKNNGKVIAKPIAVTVNEVQHPRAIFSKWSEAELNAINIFTITEDGIPNRRYYTFNEDLDEATVTRTRTPIEKPLADVQALMIKDLEDTANSKFNTTTEGYTAGEMSSWRELEDDAIAHQATPLTSGMLFDEATYSGITVTELADKVLANATTFKQAKCFISGMRKKKSLEIEALLTVSDCVLYEKTPYDYTLTAEDVVDNDGIVGAIVVRYKNNVKDW